MLVFLKSCSVEYTDPKLLLVEGYGYEATDVFHGESELIPESVPLLHRTSWYCDICGSIWKLARLPSKGLYRPLSPVNELIDVVSKELTSLAVPPNVLDAFSKDMFMGGDTALLPPVAVCGAGVRNICEQRILEGFRSQCTLRDVPRKFKAAVPHTISPRSP